jgi:hypothetical protein
MSIDQLMTRHCTQTAVYWGTPAKDGRGGYTFADAVEINCRWEKKQRMIQADNGEEIISEADVWVLQDLDIEGYLYLGTLDDLDSNPDDPREYDSYRIVNFEKIPLLGSTTAFVRKAYLGKGMG